MGTCNYCSYCSPGLLEMEAGIPGRLKKVLGMMVWTDRLVWHNRHAHSWEGMLILPDKDIALWDGHMQPHTPPPDERSYRHCRAGQEPLPLELCKIRIKSPFTNLIMFPSSLKVYQTLLRRYAIDPPLLSEVLTSTL
jgi:hypothetical protein